MAALDRFVLNKDKTMTPTPITTMAETMTETLAEAINPPIETTDLGVGKQLRQQPQSPTDQQKNHKTYTPHGIVARAQSSCLSAKETKTYLDLVATPLFVNNKDLNTGFVETNEKVVRICDIHTDTRGRVTILLPTGDGIGLPAKYTPSFDSNLVPLKVLSDHIDVEYYNTNGSVLEDEDLD